jgi:hypothetical protein
MVAIRLLRFSKRVHTVRHGNLAMLGFEAQFNFYLLDKLSLPTAIDSDPLARR